MASQTIPGSGVRVGDVQAGGCTVLVRTAGFGRLWQVQHQSRRSVRLPVGVHDRRCYERRSMDDLFLTCGIRLKF